MLVIVLVLECPHCLGDVCWAVCYSGLAVLKGFTLPRILCQSVTSPTDWWPAHLGVIKLQTRHGEAMRRSNFRAA